MKVIIAIDGSECSLEALESVVDRPWPQDTEFMVLTVIDSAPPEFSSWHSAYAPVRGESGEEEIEEAWNLINERLEFLRREFPHNHVFGNVVQGNVRDAIIAEATDWEADFIVLGSHGRRGFKRFLLGSVAEAVVSKAPCSVEVVRSAARAAEERRALRDERSVATP